MNGEPFFLIIYSLIIIHFTMKHPSVYLLTLILFALYGCSQQPAYKNTRLSAEERAEALLKELTLEEKVSLMMNGSAPIERLGIKE